MNRKMIIGILLPLLILSMFGISSNMSIEDRTVFIREDGSVDPATAPIQRVEDVYTLTGNIYDWVVVQRDNIILDGSGFTIQGTGDGTGLDLSHRNNVTVKNSTVDGFTVGIDLYASTDIKLVGNTIANITWKDIGSGIEFSLSEKSNISGNYVVDCDYGIFGIGTYGSIISGNYVIDCDKGITSGGDSNNISGNTMTINLKSIVLSGVNNIVLENDIVNSDETGITLESCYDSIIRRNTVANSKVTGITLIDSYNNVIYHNNFISNAFQVGKSESGSNTWDDGYPSGGNYWSDYTGTDTNGDGIGDTPYVIDESDQDNYPLMEPQITLAGYFRCRYYHILPILWKIYGTPVRTYIVAEDLEQHDEMVAILGGSDWYPQIEPGVPNPYHTPPHPAAIFTIHVEIVGIDEVSETETDFSAILADIKNSEARLIIHIFSADAGAAFIEQWGERTWGEMQVNAVPVGINTLGEMSDYYFTLEGKCEYETLLASTGLVVQWQAGRMEVVWTVDHPELKLWALPGWMYPYSDVNYDGFVDIFDVVILGAAFGSYPGHPHWNIRCDLKKDDNIDIFDVVTIAKDFGAVVPIPLP